MAYQYKRELLSTEEANRLANDCETYEEKLVVWTLLDSDAIALSPIDCNFRKENCYQELKFYWTR